jgi:hypothetical protein
MVSSGGGFTAGVNSSGQYVAYSEATNSWVVQSLNCSPTSVVVVNATTVYGLLPNGTVQLINGSTCTQIGSGASGIRASWIDGTLLATSNGYLFK